jgi:hypothetical protein
MAKKYTVVLTRTTDFVDHQKTGNERYCSTKSAGKYTVHQIPNPSGKRDDSDWLVFEGTTIGATIEYFKRVATSIKEK